jgi:hypothetical protein
MIAAAARQRPTNRSSRAVKSRSAMVPPVRPTLSEWYNERAWQKSHGARINAGRYAANLVSAPRWRKAASGHRLPRSSSSDATRDAKAPTPGLLAPRGRSQRRVTSSVMGITGATRHTTISFALSDPARDLPRGNATEAKWPWRYVVQLYVKTKNGVALVPGLALQDGGDLADQGKPLRSMANSIPPTAATAAACRCPPASHNRMRPDRGRPTPT